MSEMELKYALDEDAVRQLRHRFTHLAPDAAENAAERLHSVYYDTRGHRLKKAGVALRLRETPQGWVQTVKAKARNATGLQTAQEAETPVADAQIRLKAIPDKALRRTVRSLVQDRALLPVCETDIARWAILVHGPEGAQVEAALDEGRIIAGNRSETVRELELELKAGMPSALYALAAELLPGCLHHVARLSKSERGYRLARDEDDAAPAAETADLTPGMSAGAAASTLLRARTGEFLDRLGGMAQSGDATGHVELRAALARLCATLDLFEPLIGGPVFTHLRGEAEWLSGLLGRQSDLDSGCALLGAAGTGAVAADIAVLRDETLAQAGTNLRRLAELPALTRTQRFAIELAQFAELGTPPLDARQARRRAGKLRPRLRRSLDKAQAALAKGAAAATDARSNALLLPDLDRLAAQIAIAAPLLSRPEAEARRRAVAALLDTLAPVRALLLAERLWSGPDPAWPQPPEAGPALAALRRQWIDLADAALADAGALWERLAQKPGGR